MPPLYSGTNAAIINRPDFNNILQYSSSHTFPNRVKKRTDSDRPTCKFYS